jgi:hypothetical protein
LQGEIHNQGPQEDIRSNLEPKTRPLPFQTH